MNLVNRLLSVLTQLLIFVDVPLFHDYGIQQVPLHAIGDWLMPATTFVTPPTHDAKHPGPIFRPPGRRVEGPGSDFTCNYTSMKGWRSCSTPTNRSCWLTNDKGGFFDINTDYERLAPTGILRKYTLVIANGSYNADGLDFPEAKLFNDTYPGPWIQACWGDVVQITVINNMPYNGTSIHWHGIRQNQTMHMDGVNGITQCPIAPGQRFVYNWTATQYGSTWYHSHYSIQYADGLVGPLVSSIVTAPRVTVQF